MSMLLQRFMNLFLTITYYSYLEITMFSNSLRLDYSMKTRTKANLLFRNNGHILLLVRCFFNGLQERVIVDGVPLLQQLLHHGSTRITRLLRTTSNTKWILFHVILVCPIILRLDNGKEREE